MLDLQRYNRRTAYIALVAVAEAVALVVLIVRHKAQEGEELAPAPIDDPHLTRVPPPPPPSASPALAHTEEIATITLTADVSSAAARASASGKPPPTPPPVPASALPLAPAAPTDSVNVTRPTGEASSATHGEPAPLAEYRPSARADQLLGISGAGPEPAASISDLSSFARLGGNIEWHCPWPANPDAAKVDHASVRLRANVRADGHASTITILTDPGLGFGEQARSCAMGHIFVPAHDKTGQTIDGTTAPFVVQFDRFQMITK